MRKLELLLFIITTHLSVNSQILYQWTSGVNPGWTSSNSSNNTLSWQPTINTVSTSGLNGVNWHTYNNSQATSYTSPVYNFNGLCGTLLQVNLRIEVNLESSYDWLYFQYSTNGGTTWLNPVAISGNFNNSGSNLSAYVPQTAWSNNNSNRNGWTGSLGVLNLSYVIPFNTNRFRFIFSSDGSVNSYYTGFTNYIYYADVLAFNVNCAIPLGQKVISFKGENKVGYNSLQWEVMSEINTDFYTLGRSGDGFTWETIHITTENKYEHKDYVNDWGYYRLKIGNEYYEEIVLIKELNKDKKDIIKIFNLLGQETPIVLKSGVYIVFYADGSSEKLYINVN